MGAETVVTLVLVAVLVAVLAVYIIAIGLALRKLSFTLGTILIGLRAIHQQTGPVGPVVGDMITDVDVIEDALESLVGAVVSAKKMPKKTPRTAPVPAFAPAPRSEPVGPSRPGVGVESGDDWDAVIGEVDRHAPAENAVGELTLVGSRRTTARSSGRGPRGRGRQKPSPAEMREAVARDRETIESR